MNFKIFFSVIACCYIALSLNTQAMMENEEDTKCRYFNGKPGSCRYGEKCKFSHVKETPEEYRQRKEKQEAYRKKNKEAYSPFGTIDELIREREEAKLRKEKQKAQIKRERERVYQEYLVKKCMQNADPFNIRKYNYDYRNYNKNNSLSYKHVARTSKTSNIGTSISFNSSRTSSTHGSYPSSTWSNSSGASFHNIGDGYTSVSNGRGGYWTISPSGRDID